ncbi:MAG: hypothetical protein JSS72_09315 [Armatimonadetes bacterium]|nr:hypothetical protein [Armatimonadota bacterium]
MAKIIFPTPVAYWQVMNILHSRDAKATYDLIEASAQVDRVRSTRPGTSPPGIGEAVNERLWDMISWWKDYAGGDEGLGKWDGCDDTLISMLGEILGWDGADQLRLSAGWPAWRENLACEDLLLALESDEITLQALTIHLEKLLALEIRSPLRLYLIKSLQRRMKRAQGEAAAPVQPDDLVLARYICAKPKQASATIHISGRRAVMELALNAAPPSKRLRIDSAKLAQLEEEMGVRVGQSISELLLSSRT